jgi:outer membrane receptor protein involved in Fe transport
MQRSEIRRTVRLCLLAAALPAFAAGAAEPAGEELQTLDVAEVTGSRISRTAADSPNPVVSVTAETIEQSGLTNLTELLMQTPSLLASVGTTQSSGAFADGPAGINLLDLRNLGTNRTLVLVNGRRHVAGVPGTASVDINSIPMDLVERIDVLTGGVSAVYGADGVSGVVNFITKRNFEGVKTRVQTGLSEEGDAGRTLASFTAGQNFAGGKGNVALAYEFGFNDGVKIVDRAHGGDPLKTYSLTNNPDYVPGDLAHPRYVFLNDLRWIDSSRAGAYDIDADLTPDMNADGSPYDLGDYINGSYTQGGDSTPVAGYNGDLQAKTKKHVVNLLGSYDFSPAARAFFEGKYSNTRTWNSGQPTYEFYTFVGADNPFMPAAMRNAIDADAFADEWGMPPGAFVNRDNNDFGLRGDMVVRDTVRGVLGIDGHIGGNTRYELSYTYGQSKIKYDEPNHRIDERFFAALDAVDEGEYLNGVANGKIRCRIDLDPPGTSVDYTGWNYSGEPVTFTPGAGSGCVPINIFGEGAPSQEALDFIGYRIINRQKLTQQVASGSLSGDLGAFFQLPGGPLAWAAGAEWRKEESDNHPDPITAEELLWGYSAQYDEHGSFNVKEVFGEVNLPLVKGAKYADRLSIGAAVRLSDYSTVGKTTTWKTDLMYAPNSEVTFRGTYSVAVRAPNITELFAPNSGVFSSIYDPCSTNRINDGDHPDLRRANCAAILGALGVTDLSTFRPNSVAAFAGTTQPGHNSGNAGLSEEEATTWTAGVVLRPEAAPTLSIGFDWYDIKLKDAVDTPTAQTMINLCVDNPMPNQYCGLITRQTAFDPAKPTYRTGFIRDYLVSPQNVAAYTTSGADLNVTYGFTLLPEWGKFALRIDGNYLKDLTFTSLPGAQPTYNRNLAYAPKYSGEGDLTWYMGKWMVNYGVSFFSKTRRVSAATLANSSVPNYTFPENVWYSEKWQHDLRASYELGGRAGTKLYAGVNNVFGTKPDIGSTSYPMSWEGRYYYLGVNFSADKLQ